MKTFTGKLRRFFRCTSRKKNLNIPVKILPCKIQGISMLLFNEDSMNLSEYFRINPWKSVIEKGRSLFVNYQEQVTGRKKNVL